MTPAVLVLMLRTGHYHTTGVRIHFPVFVFLNSLHYIYSHHTEYKGAQGILLKQPQLSRTPQKTRTGKFILEG